MKLGSPAKMVSISFMVPCPGRKFLLSVQKRELSRFLVIYTKKNNVSNVKNHEKTGKFSLLSGR